MKSYRRLAAVAAVSIIVFGFTGMRSNGEERFERPGAKEQAAVDSANKVLDGVYRDLMSKVEPEVKPSLREAQPA